MESILNILWVVIALGALSVWRVYWSRDRRDERRNLFHEWTAIACALVLLFFAVSLTDDLHFNAALFDECSGSRRHAAVWSNPAADMHGAKMHAASAVAPELVRLDRLHGTALAEAPEQLSSAASYRISFLGRPPPNFLL
jgi:hypothetical protein